MEDTEIINDIIRLADTLVSNYNKETYYIFIKKLKMIIQKNDSQIINNIYKNTENTNSLVYIINELEQLSTSQYVTTTDNAEKIYKVNLIAIPLIFVMEANQTIPTDIKTKEFNQIIKKFKKTGICKDDDTVRLLNQLCSPDDILNINFNMAYEITNGFLSKKENMIKSHIAIEHIPEKILKNTLCMRYLIGIFISDPNDDMADRDTYDQSLTKFMSETSILLMSALHTNNLILLPPYNLYESIQYSLDIYNITGVKIQIQHILNRSRIHPHGIMLYLDVATDKIEVLSKLENKTITEIDFSLDYTKNPHGTLSELMTQLTSMDIKVEDLYIKNESNIISMKRFINENIQQTSNIDDKKVVH